MSTCKLCRKNIINPNNDEICCFNCGYNTCKKCIKTYFTENSKISCINCNFPFGKFFIYKKLGLNFSDKIYKQVLIKEQKELLIMEEPLKTLYREEFSLELQSLGFLDDSQKDIRESILKGLEDIRNLISIKYNELLSKRNNTETTYNFKNGDLTTLENIDDSLPIESVIFSNKFEDDKIYRLKIIARYIYVNYYMRPTGYKDISENIRSIRCRLYKNHFYTEQECMDDIIDINNMYDFIIIIKPIVRTIIEYIIELFRKIDDNIITQDEAIDMYLKFKDEELVMPYMFKNISYRFCEENLMFLNKISFN